MTTLFDYAASEEAKEQALDRVTAGNQAWIEYALRILEQVAYQQATLTSDDVWALVHDKPRDSRAIGAVFTIARRKGWILKTNVTTPTAKISQHGQDIRIWSSLLYRGIES